MMRSRMISTLMMTSFLLVLNGPSFGLGHQSTVPASGGQTHTDPSFGLGHQSTVPEQGRQTLLEEPSLGMDPVARAWS